MKKIFFTLTLVVISPFSLLAEGNFEKVDTGLNESFIKVMSKNRLSKTGSNYTKIKTKKEFLDSIEKNQNNKPINKRGLTTEYVYTEISNVNIKNSDLRGIKGKELNLGTSVDNGNVVNVLSIKNSKIKANRKINLAVQLDAKAKGKVSSLTNITGSKIIGKENKSSNLIPLD